MKRPLSWRQDDFSGGMVQNRRLPSPLARNECEWLENVDLVESTAASKRNGYVRLNSTPLAGAVQGIVDYKQADGTTHIMVVAGGQLYRYSGGTFNAITGTLANSAFVRVCFVPLRDMLVILNGVNAPKKYNPSTQTMADLGGAPPVASFGALHNHHLFLSGVSSAPTRVWYSETSDPEDGYDAKNYFVDMEVGDSSRVTGFLARDQEILVCKERSITAIRGMDPRDFAQPQNRAAYTDELGVLNFNCITDVGGTPWFLSRTGLYELRGPFSLAEQSFPVAGLIERLDPFRLNYCFVSQFMKTRQVKAWVPYTSGNLHMDLGLVAHPGRGRNGLSAWTAWSGLTEVTASAIGYSDVAGETHYIGDVNGYVYQLDSGHDDHTTPITMKYRSDDVDFGLPQDTKVLREIIVGADVGSSTTAAVSYSMDRGKNIASKTLSFTAPSFEAPQDTTDPLTGRQFTYSRYQTAPKGLRAQAQVIHNANAEFRLVEVSMRGFSHGRRSAP